MKTKKSFAIIGCGRFGSNLAIALTNFGQEVMILDKDEAVVNDLAPFVDYAICADVDQETSLENIGLNTFDYAIVAMSSNFEATVLATAICKEANIPHIIVKAKSERQAMILRQVGATKIVQPEKETGIRLANALSNSNIYEQIELSEDYSIVELEVPSKWAGSTLVEVDVRKNYGVNVIAILSTDQLNINPRPEDVFQKGDHVYLLGEQENILEVESLG